MIVYSNQDPSPQAIANLDHVLYWLARLLEDLRNLRAGILPDETVIADAPLIEDIRVTTRSALVLTGNVTGHPKLTLSDNPIITSELMVLVPELRLARTRSRWYRLGQEAPKSERENSSPNPSSPEMLLPAGPSNNAQ
jgi:hypothetical protein